MTAPKYRAYVKSENKIFQVEQINWTNDGIRSIRIVGLIVPAWVRQRGLKQQAYGSKTSIVMADNFELLPWTGLTDRNGVDIYEGDVGDDGIDDRYEVRSEDGAVYTVLDGNLLTGLSEV